MKEIELFAILTVPDTETEDTILAKFIDWAESQSFVFAGMIKDITQPEEKKQ